MGQSSFQEEINKMKLVFSLLAIAIICLMATTRTQAGCGQYGCCYCGSQSGRVIRRNGKYRVNCNPGAYCDCGYNDYTYTYYGVCCDRYGGCGCGNVAASLPAGSGVSISERSQHCLAR